MLSKANDRTLASRLLNGSSKELHAWLHVVARDGDVRGLATLEMISTSSLVLTVGRFTVPLPPGPQRFAFPQDALGGSRNSGSTRNEGSVDVFMWVAMAPPTPR